MAVVMKAPDTCGSVSVGGRNLPITKKGLVKVPEDSVRELLDFGFRVAPPEDSDDAEAVSSWYEAENLQAAVDQGKAEKKAVDDAETQADIDLRNKIAMAEKGI